jgi:sec-independent protein translocase protein TatA
MNIQGAGCDAALLGFMGIGPTEMVIIGIVGVLLFGKRLPEVGRSLGKSLSEFKRGMSGIETELNQAVSATSAPVTSYHEIDDSDEATAPKFEPPPAENSSVASND